MNAVTKRFMAQTDNRPPPGVKRMVVRQTTRRTLGPYTVDMQTSCGSQGSHKLGWERKRIAGSVCIRLYDSRTADPTEPVAVKRFAVDNWREADDEMRKLVAALAGSD